MRAPRRGSTYHGRASAKRPPRVRIPRRVKPGAYARHQELFDAHALASMRRENDELEEWEGITAGEPIPGDYAYMPDFRTGSLQRVGVWSAPEIEPTGASHSGARRFGSSQRIAVRALPRESSHVCPKEKLFEEWNRDREMVLRKLGLEKEEEDPIGFNTLMSTVRGQMDAARLHALLTAVILRC